MKVTTTATTTTALDTLRDAAAHGRPYDLLLLDADPGDVDTAGLARLVNADDAIPGVHIVVLNETPPPGRAADDAPTYLPKPVHRSALYDLLAQSMAAVVPAPVNHHVTPAPAPDHTRGHLLLVEDNDINQMVAVGILTGLGYRTDIAGDGLQACEMAAARTYDAILMDCRMPRMDGFTATAELRRREQEGAPRVPIIAMTASALVADRERCLAAGMDDYLAKPVNPLELSETLQRWISTPATGRSAAPTPPPAAPTSSAPVAPPADLPLSLPAAAHPAGPGDPIGRRLGELAGDRTEPEEALVRRLVMSFQERAPRHLEAITDAYRDDDARTVEDQAHSLRGAAGNIGANDVMDICRRIEDTARTRELPGSVADDLRTLALELDRVDSRLTELLVGSR